MSDGARTAAGVLLAVGVGFFPALPILFSNLGPGETEAGRAVVLGCIFFLGGALVGGVAPRRWLASAVCAWTSVGMGFLMLVSKLAFQGREPYWRAIGALLLAPLMVALAGGYLGHRLVGRIARFVANKGKRF